jgi:hypothetical protein
MMGVTSGEESAHFSEETRRVILVEEELSTLGKSNDGCY